MPENETSASPDEPVDERLPLRVLSLNVRYGNAEDGDHSWEHRRELLIDVLEKCNADVVGTQECLGYQAEYIVEHLPDYAWFGVGRLVDGLDERMVVFHKKETLSPIETGNFWLSEQPEAPGSEFPGADWPRMVTWARFYHMDARSSFAFFNTHFDNRSAKARLYSARLLAERAKGIADGLPMILVGDFNAPAGQCDPYQELMQNGFVDTWRAAKQTQGPGFTFHDFGRRRGEDGRIDWILVAGGIDVAYCETVVTDSDERYPSDHYPVLARLTLPRP